MGLTGAGVVDDGAPTLVLVLRGTADVEDIVGEGEPRIKEDWVQGFSIFREALRFFESEFRAGMLGFPVELDEGRGRSWRMVTPRRRGELAGTSNP